MEPTGHQHRPAEANLIRNILLNEDRVKEEGDRVKEEGDREQGILRS